MTMTYALTTRMTFFRRRLIALLVVAMVAAAAALAAASTSARQTLVRTHIARDGSVVVSGYDGGASLAPVAKP
jgi:ABC-type glycerol-3-phosphate transport system substrate-binding protein